MEAELTTRKTPAVAVAAVVMAVLVLAVLLAWRALGSTGSQMLHGTVSIVNAQGTKFCVTQEGQDQWCGMLAAPGGTSVSAGQQVTVLVSSVDTVTDGQISIGTVVPDEFVVK
jgi:hypothetical protein